MKTLSCCGVYGLLFLALFGVAGAGVPAPKEVLGSTPGDDYYLASNADAIRYFKALEAASDRLKLFVAGESTRGRPMYYAVISDPQNLARFEHHKDISRRLADSRSLTSAQAREVARDAKIIVHIDGGMHSNEVAVHQFPMLLAHRLLSDLQDPQVAAVLEDVLLVLWPTLNPDGQDMTVEWYRDQVSGWDIDQQVPAEAKDQPLPWLYQDYVGHDNNRDGFMLNMIESRVVIGEEQKYAPAILYSPHQTASLLPERIWLPPQVDPISGNIHPLMRVWSAKVGVETMTRLEREGKPGAVAFTRFDTWYPGFLDYVQMFRHTVAYFSEVAHPSATPRIYPLESFPERRRDLKPQIFYPSPWKGGVWRLKDSVDYLLSSAMAMLEVAVRDRENLLFDRYLAGRGTIERFTRQGPYAYVIPAGQADPQTAAYLAQKMIDHGIEVYRTREASSSKGQAFAAGSWVIRMDQPYAGLVQELFERQKYPQAFLNEQGIPPNWPSDVTGWTLPLQLGVDVDALLQPVPAELEATLQRVTQARTTGSLQGRGKSYALSRAGNASYKAVNELLRSGAAVSIASDVKSTANGTQHGDFIVSGVDRRTLRQILERHGLQATAVANHAETVPLQGLRVAVYRPWGNDNAAKDAGWAQWVLEQHGFSPTAIHDADFAAGGLLSKFDAIVLPDTAPSGKAATAAQRLLDGAFAAGSVPDQYVGGIGQPGLTELKMFVAGGGTLAALNRSSAALIDLLDLPVENALQDLGKEEFYCSGGLFQVQLAERSALSAGLSSTPAVMFVQSPAFKVEKNFPGRVLARYSMQDPLLSGFAIGSPRLHELAAAVEVEVGAGRVILFGFSPHWRGQPHGTFKFLFNTLYKVGNERTP